ncbi:hypothetical protein [Arthrobacter gengyunqii]|uniref:Uncharacterized protein n=1 Tax=Arthrobacter gengyunqii TaxID=2886940 RepID=A0ABS8GK10_9MICC|nr:hypothetical protein [Arthrobacter gengyunqii]MCC3266914.1 hypothetical protein [Arthrobacter gengyunqii]
MDTRSLKTPPQVRPLGFDRLGSKIKSPNGQLPFIKELGELSLFENPGFTLPGGPRASVNAQELMKLANQSSNAINVIRSNILDRRLIVEPDGVVFQLQMRGAWVSRAKETNVRIEEVLDAILSTEFTETRGKTDAVKLEKTGALASDKLARLTQSLDLNATGILHNRPILILQAHRKAVIDLPRFSKCPSVKLAHGTLVKITRSEGEVYLLLKDHLPHREDPLPALLSLLHASVSALEHLMSDSVTEKFPPIDPTNSLRRAQMNRLTLLRKISKDSENSVWRARLFSFYSRAQHGMVENFEDRFTHSDPQIQNIAIQIKQRITMGDSFENINNSSIINRSSNSSITINDSETLVSAIKRLKEFELPQVTQDQLDNMICEAEAGKPVSNIAQIWRTTSASLPKIAAIGTIATAIGRFLGVPV